MSKKQQPSFNMLSSKPDLVTCLTKKELEGAKAYVAFKLLEIVSQPLFPHCISEAEQDSLERLSREAKEVVEAIKSKKRVK